MIWWHNDYISGFQIETHCVLSRNKEKWKKKESWDCFGKNVMEVSLSALSFYIVCIPSLTNYTGNKVIQVIPYFSEIIKISKNGWKF